MELENRLEYNKKILELLSMLVEKYPDLRFNQILWQLEIIQKDKDGNIIDNFYEEPSVTFERIKNDYKIIAQEVALEVIYPDNIEPKHVYEKVLEKGLTADIEKELKEELL